MKTLKKITNELSSTGLTICPVCNQPPNWFKDGKLHTSPMVNIELNNLDALVHRCCLHQLYTDINGQIRIHYRKKFLLTFIPACGKFLVGAAKLIRLLSKHGIKAGLEQFKNSRRPLSSPPKMDAGSRFHKH
ncbi:MAG: hypothetical protein NTX59_08385 [Elusimicrobia bacterium]|nr:hypothetical protein [Elusimicrobiota bacterium]